VVEQPIRSGESGVSCSLQKLLGGEKIEESGGEAVVQRIILVYYTRGIGKGPSGEVAASRVSRLGPQGKKKSRETNTKGTRAKLKREEQLISFTIEGHIKKGLFNDRTWG